MVKLKKHTCYEDIHSPFWGAHLGCIWHHLQHSAFRVQWMSGYIIPGDKHRPPHCHRQYVLKLLTSVNLAIHPNENSVLA